MSALGVVQVVRLSPDGFYEFLEDGEMVYDLNPAEAAEALRWIEHLAQKTWVTKRHLEQFARLAAGSFGMGGP